MSITICRFELNGKELGNEAVQYIKICITNSDEIRFETNFNDYAQDAQIYPVL